MIFIRLNRSWVRFPQAAQIRPPGTGWAFLYALTGRAALCALGRRPAREIATREPDGSEWSISRPALALPLPTGTAARPSIPPAPSTPVGPGVLACGSARRLEARPGPEAVSAISHVIPLRIFQTMNSYRWGFNVSGPCCNFVQSNYVRLFWEW